MTSRRLPRSISLRCSSRMALGRAAWTAASATARRAAGVTAADAAWSISAGCSGWMRIRGRWPSRMPRVGSRKIVPAFLQWPNSERRAVRVVAGTAAGPALAAGAQPVPDVGGHRLRQQLEPRLRQGGEGRDPVVVQEPGEGEDFGGAGDAEVPAVQGGRELGPGDHVPGLVAGEHDGQRAAGLRGDPVVPAAGAGQVRGDAPGLLQGRAGDRRGAPVALVEVQRLAGCAQLQLGPAGCGGRRGGTARRGLPGRAGAAQAAHAR
jgi:hypothetical protein